MPPIFTCPVVKCRVGVRAFSLRMDFNAIAQAEQITGRSFLDEKMWEDMNVSAVTALFWACAVEGGDTRLTLAEVRGYSFKQLPEMVDGCRAAWRAVNELPAEDPRPTDGLEQTPNPAPAQ